MSEVLRELGELLAKGGFVAPPLVVGALALWWAMGYRYVLLFVGDRRAPRDLVKAVEEGYLTAPSGVVARAAVEGVAIVKRGLPHARRKLDEVFFGYAEQLGRGSGLASGIVKIAPLLGLLGTVSGGISEALFSTQLGLLVAIPGLLFGRLLDRRQQVVEDELDKLKDALTTGQEVAA